MKAAAFNNENTHWENSSIDKGIAWLGYEFKEPRPIKKIVVYPHRRNIIYKRGTAARVWMAKVYSDLIIGYPKGSKCPWRKLAKLAKAGTNRFDWRLVEEASNDAKNWQVQEVEFKEL
jgi:hypothetical protein